MSNNNAVLQRIMDLMSAQRITGKELSLRLGLSAGTFSQWKCDENRKSYLIHIDQIADILDTTPTYLIWGVKDEEITGLTPQESDIVKMIRKIDSKKIKCVRDMVEIFVEDASAAAQS